jgi:tRNA pseudouridine55 synthase
MAGWQDCRKEFDNQLPSCNFAISMDGLLIIDKPAGPTSHDVVARVRRALREPRVGHTGTLDPGATGVLPLVLGRATRLAQFLSGSDKTYEAVVRLGFSTDTADAQGRAIGAAMSACLPGRDAIETALESFRGTYRQRPPAFSAKKIDGTRSHTLARARRRIADGAGADASAGPEVLPAPATVTARTIQLVRVDGDRVTLVIECSAGFYVRSLAHDLGERLGVGGHLIALRRTRSGDFGLDIAAPLEKVEREPGAVGGCLIPMGNVLSRLVRVVLTADGARKALHGRDLGPSDIAAGAASAGFVTLFDPAGDLIAIARPSATPGLLHPSVVLV